METLLSYLVRALIALLQAMPLSVVARLGRAGGALFHWIDARHRKVARQNLAAAFAEKSPEEIRALAKESFKRIGENFACAVKTSGMDERRIKEILEIHGLEKFYSDPGTARGPGRVFAIGHFGNFEMFAHCQSFLRGYRCATTYRGLRQPSLNRLMQDLRARSGCLFFERRTEADELKAAMNEGGLLLALLADQHAGHSGVRLPFLGRDCSTTVAPAVFALRYNCPLFTAICYRVALGRWRIEVGDEIPTRENGQRRPAADIMLDVNRAFEAAVHRDPANWFWVHNRWKPGKKLEAPSARLEGRSNDESLKANV